GAAERDAAAEQVIGDAHAMSEHWDDAAACYARAAGERDELPAALAWRIGRIHWERGAYDEALAGYLRGSLGGADPAEEAHLLAWTALARWNRGEPDTAHALADEALARAERAGDLRALARAHHAAAIAAL